MQPFRDMPDTGLIDCFPSLFDGLDTETKQSIMARWERYEWPEEAPICWFRQRSTRMWLLAAGVMEQINHTHKVLARFGPGEIIGAGPFRTADEHKSVYYTRTKAQLIELGPAFRTVAAKSDILAKRIADVADLQQARQEAYFDQIFCASKPVRVLLLLRDVARVVSQQITADSPAKLPYTLDWPGWQSQISIGALAYGMARQTAKEALIWAHEAGAIEFSPNAEGDYAGLPLVLRSGCLEKFDALLKKHIYSDMNPANIGERELSANDGYTVV